MLFYFSWYSSGSSGNGPGPDWGDILQIKDSIKVILTILILIAGAFSLFRSRISITGKTLVI